VVGSQSDSHHGGQETERERERKKNDTLAGFLLFILLFHLSPTAHGKVLPTFRAGLPGFVKTLPEESFY
jgi:hypothetical protein